MTVAEPIAFIMVPIFAFGCIMIAFMIFVEISERVENKKARKQAEINDLRDDFHRLELHVGGYVKRKLDGMEDKIKRIEHVRSIERIKKVCDEEGFSYKILDEVEDGCVNIIIFTIHLDTLFLSEMSEIADYEIIERTGVSVTMKVCLKG